MTSEARGSATGRVVARGWATVELDRATTELADLLRSGTGFEDAPRSVVLGARCRRGRAAAGDGVDLVWIVILEPDTEGRLAGYLARHGEGWAATWSDSLPGVAATRATPGPLGSEHLAMDAPVGPFRLVLTTATIDR